MADVYHLWGNDLVAGPQVVAPGVVASGGDLLTVGGDALSFDNFTNKTTQRLLRRLLTNPGEYIWQPGYGAGLPRFLGQPLNIRAITAVIRSQIFLEESVSQTPAPVITLTAKKDGSVLCHILYTDAASGKPTPLQFSITA
jgi:phage baseplate assembly protein W